PARAAQGVPHVRQLHLPGPALSRPLDAAARGVLSLSQSRRLDAQGALPALEARAHERHPQGGQARGARRRAGIDHGAQVLPRAVHPAMNFCSHCGSGEIALRVPAGDSLPRFVCAACGSIHYQNPKVVVGCLPEWDDRVLLCKRAIEPRHGKWTLPAGFLENGESLAMGAQRETLEEASARVQMGELYTVISLPHINQVYVMFRARLVD